MEGTAGEVMASGSATSFFIDVDSASRTESGGVGRSHAGGRVGPGRSTGGLHARSATVESLSIVGALDREEIKSRIGKRRNIHFTLVHIGTSR